MPPYEALHLWQKYFKECFCGDKLYNLCYTMLVVNVLALGLANIFGGLFVISHDEILLERSRVISNNLGHAWDLPENTFGAAYAKFMGSRNFSPDDRPPNVLSVFFAVIQLL